jgi:hypothetical protein
MTVRISELNELSADLSQSDVLPIVDVSAGETKQIQTSSLLRIGISGAPSSFIDLSKLDQNSITKLGAVALDNTGVASGVYGAADTVGQFTVNDQGLVTTATGITIVIPADNVTGLAPVATSGDYQSLTDLPTLGTLSPQDADNVAITGGTISDITDLAIADGGTGASSAADARTNLGLAIGSDIQAYDAGLASIAGLTTAEDEIIYLTGVDTYAVSPFPAYVRGLIASGDSAADARTILGLGSLSVKDTVTTADIDDESVTGDKISPNSLIATNYGAGSVDEAALGEASVSASKIASSGVTATKLADNSSTIVDLGAPNTNGVFTGQQYVDTATNFVYIWDGDSWERQAAINTINFVDTTPIAFAVSYPDSVSAVVTTTLDDQAANSVFAGPSTGGAAAPEFRALVSADLPIATDTTIGAVQPGC